MRFSLSLLPSCGLVALVILCSLQSEAQQTQPGTTGSTSASTPIATKDPQAIDVLNQALTVAGGIPAIGTVTDYTGTGNVTYSQGEIQGTVTVRGLGALEFRFDADLPSGVRSWAVSNGEVTSKLGNGPVAHMSPQGPVPSSSAFPFQSPLFPSSFAFPIRQLATVLNNPSFNISYKGLSEIDGHSVHDIQLQRAASTVKAPNASYIQPRSRDIVVDASTFQVVLMRESVPKNTIHELQYADYRPVNGVLMPFSITEQLGGQKLWAIQLNQVTFNTGLQDSLFALQ